MLCGSPDKGEKTTFLNMNRILTTLKFAEQGKFSQFEFVNHFMIQEMAKEYLLSQSLPPNRNNIEACVTSVAKEYGLKPERSGESVIKAEICKQAVTVTQLDDFSIKLRKVMQPSALISATTSRVSLSQTECGASIESEYAFFAGLFGAERDIGNISKLTSSKFGERALANARSKMVAIYKSCMPTLLPSRSAESKPSQLESNVLFHQTCFLNDQDIEISCVGTEFWGYELVLESEGTKSLSAPTFSKMHELKFEVFKPPVNWTLLCQLIVNESDVSVLTEYCKGMMKVKVMGGDLLPHAQATLALKRKLTELNCHEFFAKQFASNEQEMHAILRLVPSSKLAQALLKHSPKVVEPYESESKIDFLKAVEEGRIAECGKQVGVASNKKKLLNTANGQKMYPVHIAVAGGQLLSAQFLLSQRSIDVNKKNKEGNTALHLAVQNRNIEMVKLILESNNKVDFNIKNKQQRTVLQEAVIESDVEIVELIFEIMLINKIKANSNDTTKEFAHPFDYDQVNFLYFFEKTKQHDNIMDLAIASDQPRTVEFLIQTSCFFPNGNDKDREPPLIRAVRCGSNQVLNELLRFSYLKLDCKYLGQNVLDVAIDKNNLIAAVTLLKAFERGE
ncbi:hypothetical protein D5R81_09455 [Parashewanella spongiae]|uniref:Uncharacterized protein n=1 Tax=Parashewanella spongiae TaxID=342950 RepID=A0A3A6U4P4_9GAMM|nr:ankyrin repeat domain-containing protein [Parashewanella spongiae]MCL1078118.1 ankyrin repeat domain-containing protein [Parashewanella spongiae]RJY16364.1 hypothetical protein D5R81_09455 [Parashewanella spongiae]